MLYSRFQLSSKYFMSIVQNIRFGRYDLGFVVLEAGEDVAGRLLLHLLLLLRLRLEAMNCQKELSNRFICC